ncbi:MAG: hypothetical protein R3F20_14430 [Planctomycetota bacterium]
MHDLLKAVLAGSLLLLAACGSPGPEVRSVESERAELREFGAHYGYDVGYMEKLLDLSRSSYDAFAAAMAMSAHREHLPVEAHHVACISALMADDCGQCTQLGLRMALEEGVERETLRRLIESPRDLPPELLLVHEYATQVVRGENVDDDRINALRETYGDAALGELAVNVIGCRIYPALRRSLGSETSCPRPTLGGRWKPWRASASPVEDQSRRPNQAQPVIA